jgi:Haem-dependent oxidative N-demethylase, alpha subunit-like
MSEVLVRLPEETIHLPFEAGEFRMSMNLTAAPDSAWFELDARYPDEMRQRRDLLAERHEEVFGALPGTDAARAEALEMVVANLTRHHPAWFDQGDTRLHNRLTGESWTLAPPECDLLELAGRLVQEDLCIIQDSADGPRFTAAVLCFPSRWRLHDKLGRPLAAVHGPVPLYADRLARPVDRFMRHVKPGHIAQRLNWSVMDDPALFQTGGHWRGGTNPAITAANAGATLYLRVERQTLRRLPRSDAVLFGIRVHVYLLAAVIASPAPAARMAAAVRALPAEINGYKSLGTFRDALLGWLDSRV